ncbi:putative efflux transporter [Streptomyces scabiei 87.22]|uniref:Putative efflux transporter n=1 Tax=Streptomyces scabiei (strain 87.22) TaxID=680198 RepID=C9ZAN7_STRSW|nr:MATE family efflux transporter [Streptomyces sp. LBUM 1484]MBP5868425.1 MATE family efflux transporter [Streptomyces sp. LBUM 1485]MBP5876961.1 MATE family efflux transporter [Streptomyces sp. LBUM 1477]MBP5884742.1 MATE family efflux transporter [Streptomyces sp. LBUM 1487]MBP5892473.1 MATE family efflux transporter [Streptomyces sp. LBUM 1481]MBP5900704.1 MATE family efflux transporter [Streptomyces sp. LBUM 1488]MBP5915654.1 MATE family efflux transporter [Streptomyces sp. LBUM 1486]MB
MVLMTQASAPPKATRRRHDREIITLAVPAFGALVAEPLFLMVDTAVVGHLGTAQLAGLGVASALLVTAVSVFVFLAYATTAAVARRVGAGDLRAAIRQGIDGIWLSLLLGIAVVAVVMPTAPALVALFGSSDTAAPYATTYLRISALGIPAMLVVLAATGVLRGLQDTKTPLYVAVAGFVANGALNAFLVYGADLGIAGSAWGTVIAQLGMAVAYLWVVIRGARRHGASLRPDVDGIRASAQAGMPLLVRTLSLRAVLIIATAVAARLGDEDIAAHQIILSLWSLLAFALDAIAIAGQAIIGRYLGADDAQGAREACRRMVQWGIATGSVLGTLVLLARPVFIPLFTDDPAVQRAALPALIVVALAQPVSGIVFVLDGVLMGAGDGPYLARAMLLTLVVFVPAALLVPALGAGLTALWGAMTLMMATRMLTLWLRSRSGLWIVTGATR